jgi:Ca2+-binding EF-hand superfamily protein
MYKNPNQRRPPLSKLVFKKYDVDQNGYIRIDEMRRMVYDMGYVMSEAELVAAATQLDQNGDGKITYEEFRVCNH